MGGKVTSPSAESQLELAFVDTGRLATLCSLVAHLRAGTPVHARSIWPRLTDVEWINFLVFVHGSLLPPRASRATRALLADYLNLVDQADRQQSDAERQRRRRTSFGPDLFRNAEHTYELSLVALERIVLRHPVVLGYLDPRPQFDKPAWRAAPRKWTVPRLGRYTDPQLTRIYRPEDAETSARASDFLDQLVERELGRLERLNQLLDVLDGEIPLCSTLLGTEAATKKSSGASYPSFFRNLNE